MPSKKDFTQGILKIGSIQAFKKLFLYKGSKNGFIQRLLKMFEKRVLSKSFPKMGSMQNNSKNGFYASVPNMHSHSNNDLKADGNK